MPLLRETPLPFYAHNECAYAHEVLGKRGWSSFSDMLSAFSLPCSASEQKLSVERKQGKGLVKGFRLQESFCMTNHACTLSCRARDLFGQGLGPRCVIIDIVPKRMLYWDQSCSKRLGLLLRQG